MQILGSTGKASYARVSYTEMRPISLLRVVFVGGLLISGIYLSFDVLPRLDIPPAVAIGALLAFLSNFFLQTWRGRGEREQAEAVEMERQQDAALATYAEKLSELITEKNLPERSKDPHIRLVAQALTTYLLRRLDSEHKRQVLALVYEMGLVEKEDPLLDLRTADLGFANLSELILLNACLKGADLRHANLYGAALEGTNLSLADLRAANLRNADLTGVDLTGANLLPYDERNPARWSRRNLEKHNNLNIGDFSRETLRFLPSSTEGSTSRWLTVTNLRETILRDAQLRKAWLHGVNLSGADLEGADLGGAKGITNEQLDQQASSLTGATMPNGQQYEDWLKDREGGKENEKNG